MALFLLQPSAPDAQEDDLLDDTDAVLEELGLRYWQPECTRRIWVKASRGRGLAHFRVPKVACQFVSFYCRPLCYAFFKRKMANEILPNSPTVLCVEYER